VNCIDFIQRMNMSMFAKIHALIFEICKVCYKMNITYVSLGHFMGPAASMARPDLVPAARKQPLGAQVFPPERVTRRTVSRPICAHAWRLPA
jgi:hypothetical protein